VIDENGNGFLSFDEVFAACSGVFREMFSGAEK